MSAEGARRSTVQTLYSNYEIVDRNAIYLSRGRWDRAVTKTLLFMQLPSAQQPDSLFHVRKHKTLPRLRSFL